MTRSELEMMSWRELLKLYCGIIEDTEPLRLPAEELAPHGYPETKQKLVNALCQHYRTP